MPVMRMHPLVLQSLMISPTLLLSLCPFRALSEKKSGRIWYSYIFRTDENLIVRANVSVDNFLIAMEDPLTYFPYEKVSEEQIEDPETLKKLRKNFMVRYNKWE